MRKGESTGNLSTFYPPHPRRDLPESEVQSISVAKLPCQDSLSFSVLLD